MRGAGVNAGLLLAVAWASRRTAPWYDSIVDKYASEINILRGARAGLLPFRAVEILKAVGMSGAEKAFETVEAFRVSKVVRLAGVTMLMEGSVLTRLDDLARILTAVPRPAAVRPRTKHWTNCMMGELWGKEWDARGII